MRVALVQLAAGVDNARNRELVDDRLGALGPADGLDLVVLPEATMHDFGSPEHDLRRDAEPLDGPFARALAAHARRLGATVIGGMFEATGSGLPYNTLVALGAAGELVADYRKIHLYDSFGYRESNRLRAGDIAPVVIEIAGARVGLMTCYDLRFPEMSRLLVDAGAELIVMPAAWVAGERKLDHWRTLTLARAIENTVFVVAAGQGGSRYTGHSLVADPWGSIVVEASDGDETVVADLDLAQVARAREVNPSLANRRISAP